MESVAISAESRESFGNSSGDDEEKSAFDEVLEEVADAREIATKEAMLEEIRQSREKMRKKNVFDPKRCSFSPSIGIAKGKRCKNRRHSESPYCSQHKAYVRRRDLRTARTPVKRRSRRSRNSRQRRSRRSKVDDLGPPPAALTAEEMELEIDVVTVTPPSPEMAELEERIRNL